MLLYTDNIILSEDIDLPLSLFLLEFLIINVFFFSFLSSAKVRTLRLIILPEADADSIGRASKRRIYLLLFIAVLQPCLMFVLTRHLQPLHEETKAL